MTDNNQKTTLQSKSQTSSEQTGASQTDSAKSNAKKVFLISVLIALPLCIYLIFFANGTFYTLSGHGMIALSIAVIVTILSAFFFMGMSFFSSRSGIDEQPNYREIVERQRERDQS